MKKFMIASILLALLISGTSLKAQDQRRESLGLPGDNLNLYAVMKLFQESETLEGFEKSLNDENTKINNLDLNGDGYVDYIKVIDYVDGNVHNIVLQVAVNKSENQDVAAFTVIRDNNGQVEIQLTGDEELYGKNYIVEPIFDDPNGTPNPGYMGNATTIDGRTVQVVRTSRVELATWPVVQFIYLPGYVSWHSSWYYDYYPTYYHAWHPYSWDFYYGYHYNWYNDYYAHYRRWDHHRYDHWNDYYWVGRRTYSSHVQSRINQGVYKSTYSHPEQRRAGEALYVKMYKDQEHRPSERSSGNMDRRSDSKSTPNSQGRNTMVTRRAPPPITEKADINSSAERNTVTGRRASSTMTTKSVTRSSVQPNSNTNRRATTTETSKSVTRSSTVGNAGAARRSTSSSTNRAASTTPSTNRAASTTPSTNRAASTTPSTNRAASTSSSGQKSMTSPASGTRKSEVSAPNRRNNTVSKPKTTPAKTDKIKDTDRSNDSRRK